MKRLLLVLALVALNLGMQAQTGLYKRYAHRPGVQAYCVDRYPLSSGDSVCVTLLQTDDSTVYRTLLRELRALPYAARRSRAEESVRYESTDSDPLPMIPEVAEQMKQMADSMHRHWREHKHLVVFNADGLPGDRGHYSIYCPSDRMVVLAFLVGSDDESLKVAGHMLSSEFKQ